MSIRETLWKHRPENDIREVIQKGGNVAGALVNYTLGSRGVPQAMIVEPASQPRRSFEAEMKRVGNFVPLTLMQEGGRE